MKWKRVPDYSILSSVAIKKYINLRKINNFIDIKSYEKIFEDVFVYFFELFWQF